VIVITLVSDRKAYAWREWLENLRTILPDCQLRVILDEPAPYAAETLEELWPEAVWRGVTVPPIENENRWFSKRVGYLREQARLAYLETGDEEGVLWIDCDTFPPPGVEALADWELPCGVVPTRDVAIEHLIIIGRLAESNLTIKLDEIPAQPMPIYLAPFACTYTSRELLEEISLADCDDWSEGEDGYFCREAIKLGSPPVLVPGVRCLHVGEDLRAYGVSEEHKGLIFFPREEAVGEPEEVLVYNGPNSRCALGSMGVYVRGEPVFCDHKHFEELKGLPEFEPKLIGRPLLVCTIPKRW